MRFFIAGLGNFSRSWKLAEEMVPVADDLGFYGLVMPDHFIWDRSESRDRKSTFDTLTAFSFLAAKTRHLMLATLVTPIPFRPPAILAKIVSSLDFISSDRVILGVGAGWSRTEFEAYSKWDDARTRVDKTDEGVRLIKRLWTEDKVDFEGKFYHSKGALIEPKPLQKPHPPLLFGGVSPRMFRMAGKFGDLCFIPPWTKIPFKAAKSIVEKSATEAGRANKVKFGAGSPSIYGRRFDMDAVAKEIESASNSGCDFYVIAFPQDDYASSMKKFSRDILCSYDKQTKLLA